MVECQTTWIEHVVHFGSTTTQVPPSAHPPPPWPYRGREAENVAVVARADGWHQRLQQVIEE